MSSIHYLGIDVGGTKILCQAFDDSLELVDETKQPTDLEHGSDGIMEALISLIGQYQSESLKGVGIALPGIVSRQTGALIEAPNLPTEPNLEIRAILEEKFGVPVHTVNDINAFLAAEYERPEVNRFNTVLGVMAGTGLGGAAIVNGEILYGERGFATEFGHIVIDRDGELKTLEQNTGGTHHHRISGDAKAHVVESLGIGLANFCLVFDPGAIVLGGSVYHNFAADQKDRLEAIIQEHTLDHSAPELIDASSDTSVAKGAVLLLIRRPDSA